MSSETKSGKTYRRWTRLMRMGRACGCHQMSSRSFFWKGMQFPLCARCTGLLVGEVVLAPLWILFVPQVWWIDLLLVMPLAIDGSGQYVGWWKSTNIRRLLTGLVAGTGIIGVAFIILSELIRWAL
jgi:uncharacterized membrane protein